MLRCMRTKDRYKIVSNVEDNKSFQITGDSNIKWIIITHFTKDKFESLKLKCPIKSK